MDLGPAVLADATDRGQIQGVNHCWRELTQRAHDYGVQVMIEGPGPCSHQCRLLRIIAAGKKAFVMMLPFYVLGPVVTDIAPGVRPYYRPPSAGAYSRFGRG